MLCLLPSTVQSSIAFTSIARGNVAAALCAATASNLFGILLTPLLAGLLLSAHGGFSARRGRHRAAASAAVRRRPARPAADRQWVGRRKALTSFVDRGSILLIVYVAFSEGVTHGIWHQLDATHLAIAVAAGCRRCWLPCCWRPARISRLLGFSRADQITIVFCGSKKSLASGLPMASVLFAGQSVGSDRAAADAVPPDPAHGVRRAGPAVCGGADARTAVDATCRQWSVSGERILGRDAERREVAQVPGQNRQVMHLGRRRNGDVGEPRCSTEAVVICSWSAGSGQAITCCGGG